MSRKNYPPKAARRVANPVFLFCLSIAFPLISPIASVGQDEKPTAEQILDFHIKAIGGQERLESISSISSISTIEKVGLPGQPTITPRVTHKQLNGMYLLSIEVPEKGTILQGSNGEHYWKIDPTEGPSLLEGDQLEEVKRKTTRIFNELTWKEGGGGEVTYGGTEEVAGKTCYKLLFEKENTHPITRFIEKETGRLLKVETSRNTKIGVVGVEISKSDFRTVNGINAAHVVKTATPEGISTTTFEALEFGIEFPAGTFDLPEEIQKLIDEQK